MRLILFIDDKLTSISLVKLFFLFDLASMEIVTDFRELATDDLVQIPLLDEALDVSTIGAVEGILRVFAALFLSGPSECTVKVELVHSAEVATSLLD